MDYTQIAARLGPARSFRLLQSLYSGIDKACDRNGLHKIHTIGDCYAIASSHPDSPNKDYHAQVVRLAQAAKEIQQFVAATLAGELRMRVGIHVAELLWAKMGLKERQYYDVFGEGVRSVSGLQNACRPGGILLSPEAMRLAN